MSYARWGCSDVYVYADTGGGWTTHLVTYPADRPFAGETFNDPTPSACADRLELLRSHGWDVPQEAIDRLRDEAAPSQEGDSDG